MKIKLKYFSMIKDATGKSEEILEIDRSADESFTLHDLFNHMVSVYPPLKNYESDLRFALNLEYVTSTDTVCDGDEVAFITPVSGG